jgi:hypothetical protein
LTTTHTAAEGGDHARTGGDSLDQDAYGCGMPEPRSFGFTIVPRRSLQAEDEEQQQQQQQQQQEAGEAILKSSIHYYDQLPQL